MRGKECVILFFYIKSIATFCSDPISEVKIEFGKNALAISGAVSNLAQHPHQQEARRGEKGDGETNHAIKSEMSNKPAIIAPGSGKILLSIQSCNLYRIRSLSVSTFASCSMLVDGLACAMFVLR